MTRLFIVAIIFRTATVFYKLQLYNNGTTTTLFLVLVLFLFLFLFLCTTCSPRMSIYLPYTIHHPFITLIVSPRLYIYRCALVTCPLHPCIEGMLLFCGFVAIATARKCTFCGLDSSGKAHEFDLSSLPSKTFELNDSRNSERYAVTTPCGNADTLQCGEQAAPVLQGCKGVGSLADRSEPGTGVRSWLDCVFVDLWFLFESILSVHCPPPRILSSLIHNN